MSNHPARNPRPRRILAASLLGFTTLFSGADFAGAATDEESWFTDFFAQHGEAALKEHSDWHSMHHHANAGTEFLSFHHEYIRKYELWRARQGLPPIPMWDPGTALPTDIAHTARGSFFRPTPTPTWATRAGGADQSPRHDYLRLADFRSTNELGLELNGSWHSDVHINVGGDMAFASTAPRDPVFWRWHKYLDGIWQEWRQGQARADFNLDFAPDVLWYDSQSGETSVWFTTTTFPASNGSVSFLGFDQRTVQHPEAPWEPVGTGDFDGDRKSDVVWRNQDTSEIAIWRMDGTRALSQTTRATPASPWQLQAINDFDGDGKADLLWRNPSSGAVAIFMMEGSAVIRTARLPVVPAPSQVVSSADFDRDGDADLVWRNSDTGETSVSFIGPAAAGLGVARTLRIDADQAQASTGWEVVGTGDFDGDLIPDLVLRNKSGQSIAIWLMTADGVKERRVHDGLPSTYAGPAIIDLDADGKSDLVWHNEQQARGPSAGLSVVWHMNGSQVGRQQTLAPMPTTARIVPVR